MSSGQQAGGGGEGAAPSGGLARLSESEQKLVAKLLSDPTYFPVEFRTWLKQFFEGADIRITAGQIVGGGGSNVATGLPPGIILPVAAAGAIPADSLLCDGSVKSRTDFLALFNIIGVAWGAGDGTTTFNIPDLRDRALYGQGGKISVAQTDGVAFGSRGGPEHSHSIGIASDAAGDHSHGVSVDVSVGVSVSGSTGGAGGHDHAPGGGGGFAKNEGQTFQHATGTANTRYNIVNYTSGTDYEGDHSHSVSASGGGSGSGSGGTDTQGSHQHWVAGATSGGYALDRASFAGVLYVITTGG
jgi:microcystin-dependent protein